MTIKTLLESYKLNQLQMAEFLGIGQGSFSEKLNGARGNKFSEAQKEKIIEYLNKLSKDINSVIS